MKMRRVLLVFLIVTALCFTLPVMPALAATGYFMYSGQDIGSDDTHDLGVALGDICTLSLILPLSNCQFTG